LGPVAGGKDPDPQHAAVPSLAPVSRLTLEARVAANLLFSTASWDSHAAAADAGRFHRGRGSARVLSFRPDASWIPVVAAPGD